MNKETADKVIELLEAVAARPALYFGNSSDYRGLLYFLGGFWACLSTLGLKWPMRTAFPEVLNQRGWSADLSTNEMKDKGLSDEEVARELLAVEIDIWKAFRQTFDQ